MAGSGRTSRQHWLMPHGGGDLGLLRLDSSDVAPPGCGQVLVRVERIGLNFADVFAVAGLYSPIRSGELEGPLVPGLEFAGVVEQVGAPSAVRGPDSLRGADQVGHGGQLMLLSEQVWATAEREAPKLRPGDRVMGCMRFGAFATHVNVPAHQVRKLPEGWTVAQGAAFTAQTLTAYYALRVLGDLKKDQTVLVHSAAGGCGLQAIRICRKLGARVVGTVSSAAKVTALLKEFPDLKPEQLIVRASSAAAFGTQLDSALAAIGSPAGFDIVLDAILGPLFQPAFDRLAPGGRHVVFGAASMTPQADRLGWLEWIKLAWQWLWRPKVDLLELPSLNRSVMAFNLIHCLNDAPTLMATMDEIQALNLAPPLVGSEFSFAEVPAALRAFRSGTTWGKVVISVP
mmetsp:Transcript_18902/g.60395  ORF Transcript_18902/g.60395 Transcript_18902/m.60395 type:complete len:400 (-) Transcript_18902:457-1656(-)